MESQAHCTTIRDRSVRAGGRARLFPGRHNRNQTSRSVWSAWSLLPLSNRATHPTAGASPRTPYASRDTTALVIRLCNLLRIPENLRKKTRFSPVLFSAPRPSTGSRPGALKIPQGDALPTVSGPITMIGDRRWREPRNKRNTRKRVHERDDSAPAAAKSKVHKAPGELPRLGTGVASS